ncbi:MAG: ATP-binding cassette domain-containing protein [Paracoccaceae bacterium]
MLRIHKNMGGDAARRQCLEWLDRVRIPEAERRLGQYPHELSGGMRQRVMIAQAMLCQPRLLIADEPTTALDVTVQAEILDLMDKLKSEEGTAIALITHDMGVVARMCDRIQVMRLGSYVEEGAVDDIFHAPKHDYTRMLLDAMPRIDKPEPPASVVAEGGDFLNVRDVRVHFPLRVSKGLFSKKIPLKAVDGVSFDLKRGETLGIVGESGCGNPRWRARCCN